MQGVVSFSASAGAKGPERSAEPVAEVEAENDRARASRNFGNSSK